MARHDANRERLNALSGGASCADACALFDALPAVDAAELTGRWRGAELPTGHPMDGLLEASGWYGKQFDDPESVHPLLFADGSGEIFAVDPRRIPLGMVERLPRAVVDNSARLLDVGRALVRTSKPRARLRNVTYRGVSTAAMIYDHLPIIDAFRRVDADTLLGAMDLRGSDRPYFFVLTADS